ncbi:hypothetical protein QAD02_019221 [Eretmocerus hayati]|uniref:Uncharacterized protein n=1 Tax=Eretmocerus hayati TaxID=131215 RepID=A0ACC2PJE8_9HYME|nr:hypothetical protein QAD02_019221 [Eretmocerus hayati]
MGVKDLWNILTPLSDRKPLFELQGKTIAIDLSCWVVDSQNVTDNFAQPKMYLRNLFFRTSHFLLHDIFPIFVLEGTAPDLKHKTIAKRNEIRHGGGEKKTKKPGRSRFNYILRECEEMLKCMGVACIKGEGEAEAMCAYLNEDGLVDGCISQDSDCFLYGAKVVYRNFCTNTQGNRTTSGGSIDEYSLDKISQVFDLGRNKMIALALLCGCDYDDGVNGVGKESALKLFKTVNDDEILDRLKSWSKDSKFRRMEEELSNPNICTNCGHNGKMRSHVKIGCVDCGTSVKCNDIYKERRTTISNELAIRKKALLTENFPNQELIDEFLVRKGSVPSTLELKWKKPNIMKFINLTVKALQWEPSYAFAKIFPLMTRWQLKNLIEFPLQQRLNSKNIFIPEKIKKIRNIRGVASYEILWIDKDHILEGLVLTTPESDKENDDDENSEPSTELATIEPQEAVTKCYPSLVEEFENERNAKKKKPSKSRKKKDEGMDTQKAIEPKRPEKKKRDKVKSIEPINNKKIEDYITIKKHEPSLEQSFRRMSITPKRRKKEENSGTPVMYKRGPQFDKVMTSERLDSILNGSLEVMFNQLTPEDFASDADESVDMSMIIDNICSRNADSHNIFVEYQETAASDHTCDNEIHLENERDFGISECKNNSFGLKKSALLKIEKRFAVDDCIENEEMTQKNGVSDHDFDEFDDLDQTYVPLDRRLSKNNQIKRSARISSEDRGKDRFSFGIDSLLNDTD